MRPSGVAPHGARWSSPTSHTGGRFATQHYCKLSYGPCSWEGTRYERIDRNDRTVPRRRYQSRHTRPDRRCTILQAQGLREHDPLFWSELSQCWIVTGHAEITEGFSGTLPLLNGKMEAVLSRVLPLEVLQQRYPNTLRYMPRILPNMDGPEHARLRKLSSRHSAARSSRICGPTFVSVSRRYSTALPRSGSSSSTRASRASCPAP